MLSRLVEMLLKKKTKSKSHLSLCQIDCTYARVLIRPYYFAHPREASNAHCLENKRTFCLAAIMKVV